MALYEFQCPKCKSIHEAFQSIKDVTSIGDVNKSVQCPKCKCGCQRIISLPSPGGAPAEVWEYDYTHKCKPLYVKDSKGRREKFNPDTHRKGRKGHGAAPSKLPKNAIRWRKDQP